MKIEKGLIVYNVLVYDFVGAKQSRKLINKINL